MVRVVCRTGGCVKFTQCFVGVLLGQVPTFDSDANHGGNEWVSIYNDSKTYVPVEEDVGRILRVECKALLANGDILAGKLN